MGNQLELFEAECYQAIKISLCVRNDRERTFPFRSDRN